MFKIVQVAPELVNPYAIGHLINHPPPDVPANVIHKMIILLLFVYRHS
jgi:hypothetical protein